MRMQVADSLINDFAHDQVYLIGPDTKPLMVASPSLVTFSPKKSDLSDDVVAIAAEATDGDRLPVSVAVAGSTGNRRSRPCHLATARIMRLVRSMARLSGC